MFFLWHGSIRGSAVVIGFHLNFEPIRVQLAAGIKGEAHLPGAGRQGAGALYMWRRQG